MHSIYESITSSGMNFMVYTMPLIVIFSVLLIISNVELLRHERVRLQNILGILAALILLAGEAVGLYLYRKDYAGSFDNYRIFMMGINTYGIIFTYFECVLAGAVICGLRAAAHVPEMNLDYILILGCGFRKDGTLTPLLKGRCDRAADFWKAQKENTGKEAVLIPSGGQGPDEVMPEAEAMERYLLSCGIPKECIRKEDQSRNTYQNMQFSKEIIGDPDAKTAYATTNYHVFRSGVWAGLAGLRAEGMGSRTKWWFWPNAFLREVVGLLINRIVPEIMVLVINTAVFTIMTWMVVR